MQNEQYANRPQAQPDLNNNAFPNLQAHTEQAPPPTAASNQEAMDIQFKRLQQQQQAAADRQKKLDALVQAKRAERQANKTPTQNTETGQENKGEKEKNATEEDNEDDWETEQVVHPVQLFQAQNRPALEQVADALEKHRKQHVAEGEEVELLKQVIPAELTAPKQAPAAKMTVSELMPSGQSLETGQVDPQMIANLPNS